MAAGGMRRVGRPSRRVHEAIQHLGRHLVRLAPVHPRPDKSNSRRQHQLFRHLYARRPAYYGQYVGLPAIYHHPGSWSTSGAVYPSFMYSRDGTNWSMPDAYHPIIDLSAHGQNESNFGQAYTATSMVEHNGQLYIYYSYFPREPQQRHSSRPAKYAWPRCPKIGSWASSRPRAASARGPLRPSRCPTIRAT